MEEISITFAITFYFYYVRLIFGLSCPLRLITGLAVCVPDNVPHRIDASQESLVSFFLSRFPFKSIYDSQDSRGRGRVSLPLLFTTSTRFTDT